MSWLDHFRRIVFFTGAGMSAESGVPTYRGQGGLWEEYRYQDYACQAAFDRDPAAVWEFHDKRRAALGACQPNPGHRMIAELQARHPNVTIITQNIDGLHQQAGATRVHELHGSLWRVRCDRCGAVLETRAVPLGDYHHDCGDFWRPDLVWFGDRLPARTVESALEAIRGCNLLVSIGTSGVVEPAAEFPLEARREGAFLIEINPAETKLSDIYDEVLRGGASEMLARLAERK